MIYCRSMFYEFSFFEVIISLISVQFLNTSIIFSFLDPTRFTSVSRISLLSGFAPRYPVSFSMLTGVEAIFLCGYSSSLSYSSIYELLWLSRPSLVPAVVVLLYPPTLLFELLLIEEVAGPPFPALVDRSFPPLTLGTIIGGWFSLLCSLAVDYAIGGFSFLALCSWYAFIFSSCILNSAIF